MASLGSAALQAADRQVEAGRCWANTIQGEQFAVCAFLDGGSLVTVVDGVETSPARAGARALQVREASIS